MATVRAAREHGRDNPRPRSKRTSPRGHLKLRRLRSVMTPSRKMTSEQEIVNAVTMLLAPMLTLFVLWFHDSARNASPHCLRMAHISLFGLLLHMPFSQLYHLKCAWAPSMHQTCNPYVRLDLCMMHVTAAVYAFALCGGRGAPFLMATTAYNLLCFASKWENGPWGELNSSKNMFQIGTATGLYMVPMLARGDWQNFSGTLASFCVGGFIFKFYPFGGYSHALFHVVCGVSQQWFCLQSVLAQDEEWQWGL